MRKVTIKVPIRGDEIEIYAPTVRVMRIASQEKTDDEKNIKLCMSCTNMSNDEIENLDVLDFKVIDNAVADFLQEK